MRTRRSKPQPPVEPTTAHASFADEEIAAMVVAGRQEYYAVLVRRHSDRLYRHAVHMTGSPDVAEDVVQSAFIKAYSQLTTLNGRFEPWLFRIATNECRDWLKNVRRRHFSYDEDNEPSRLAGPAEHVERGEIGSQLDAALAQLPVPLREAFLLKHLDGRSYEEMSVLLNASVGALKMRVHRAREALQETLDPYYRTGATRRAQASGWVNGG